MSWNEIDIGESNVRFIACGNFPSTLQRLRIVETHSVLPFLPLAFASSVKAHGHHCGFDCFLSFLSTLFFLPAVTLLIGSGAAFDCSCDLEQFYPLFFAQHLHDIHSDKSHGGQIMLKVLECDMEWDDPPFGQRMDC